MVSLSWSVALMTATDEPVSDSKNDCITELLQQLNTEVFLDIYS